MTRGRQQRTDHPRSRRADGSFDNSLVDRAIDTAVVERRIVGARVLVSVHGQVVHARSAGLADREASVELAGDPVFLLASITKPIVSTTAMSLVESGDLHLEAPVTDYLPDFRPSLPDGSVPVPTVEQLLTHTAGLSYGMDPAGFERFLAEGASNGLDRPGLPADEAARRLARVPMVCAPGRQWSYSLGLDVVGWAIEAVTGRRLGDVVAERVTGPLAMTETGFAMPDPARAVPAYYANASPHPQRIGDGFVQECNGSRTALAPRRIHDPRSYHSGGAGMAGTAADVLTFLEAVRLGRLVEPVTHARMLRVHAGQDCTSYGPGVGFGIGWAVLTDPAVNRSPQSVGTLCWGGAYGHSWFVDAARGLTVLALTNTGPEGSLGAFPVELRDAVYAALEGWPGRVHSGPARA